jgi:hypothetical protein
MRFTPSLVVIAIGAVIRYACRVHSHTIDVATIGLIIMLAGIATLLVRLLENPKTDRRRPSQDDLVEVDQRFAPRRSPDLLVVDERLSGTRPTPGDELAAPASQPAPPASVVRQHYAADENEPQIYSITGQPIRH